MGLPDSFHPPYVAVEAESCRDHSLQSHSWQWKPTGLRAGQDPKLGKNLGL